MDNIEYYYVGRIYQNYLDHKQDKEISFSIPYNNKINIHNVRYLVSALINKTEVKVKVKCFPGIGWTLKMYNVYNK